MVEKRLSLATVRRMFPRTISLVMTQIQPMPSLATVRRRWVKSQAKAEVGGEVEAEEEQRPGRRHQRRGQLPKGRPNKNAGRFALCFARPTFCFSLNKRGALIAAEICNVCAGTLQLQARKPKKSSRTRRSL